MFPDTKKDLIAATARLFSWAILSGIAFYLLTRCF